MKHTMLAAAFALIVGVGEPMKRDSWNEAADKAHKLFIFHCMQTNPTPVCQRLWRMRGPFG